MRKSIVALSLSLICVNFASAQSTQTRSTTSATAETSTTANTSGISLENEARVSAELEKSLDVRKANIGDEVVLKTTQAIKSDGRVIVDKGARLFGRVTDVAKNSNNGPSRIGILFNRLEKGPLAMQIRAIIASVSNVSTSARLSDDTTSTRTTSSTSSSTLIGPGGLISSTSAVLGSTVNSTADTVNTSTTGLATIQISQSSNTSVQGESVLSLRGGNLRLEKGTKFNLVVTQSANAGSGREQ